MRALFIDGENELRLGETPKPRRVAGEYLLKVAVCCVCGSDLHYYTEGRLGGRIIKKPQIPGHEISAWVWDDRAEKIGLKKGQLIAVEPSRFCGKCEFCLTGQPQLCTDIRFHGSPPNPGAMCEFITAPEEAIFAVPENFTAEMTAGLEPVGIGIHAMRKTGLQISETVAILGCGPIGLILLQLARAGGAGKVYCIDPEAYRAEKAREFGADQVADDHRRIADWTGGRGVDLVIEATTSPDAFAQAVAAVRPAGRIVLVGVPVGVNYHEMDAMSFRSKEPVVRICNRMGEVFPEAVEAVRRGFVNIESLITHRGALDDAPEIFRRQAAHADGVIKSAVYPNGFPG